MIEYETGKITTRTLAMVLADNLVMCAICAKQNNLLETEEWKWFKNIAKSQKRIIGLSNQAKL